MAEYLLAHDLGTTGNKGTLYTPEGQLVASYACSYPTHYFNGNWAEQNPDDWWQAICVSTRKLLEQAAVRPEEIEVVALSGQMMGCTPVDGQGNALRPSILYCDQRATEQANEILSMIGAESFYRIVGHRVSASYTLEKLMWIRDHEPEVFSRTVKTLCAKDYINCRLTGRMATDYSDASGTNAFDLNRVCWSEEILSAARIAPKLFPEPMESSSILGVVSARAASQTGLKTGTLVAVGGGDGSCAGVGVGCVRPGSAYNYLGSSSWIALTVKEPIVDPAMRTMNWAHCVPGYLHPSGTMQTAGATHKWIKETLCAKEEAEAERCGRDVYELLDEAIAGVPAGSRGVLFLPYLLGERTPWWNPDARAAFVGVGLATRREDLLRAALEGVSMNLGLILNIFRNHVPIDSVTMIGGGARSAVWRQMLADVFACPVRPLNYLEEATSMGAAVIGGVAAQVFSNFDVIDRFVRVEQEALPRPEQTAVYAALMPVFEKAYRSLIDVYTDLARLNQ
ncbi:MAG: xylulokinase [Terracidiphilus sp.]